MPNKKEINIKFFIIFSLSLFVLTLAIMLFVVIKPYFNDTGNNERALDERYYFKEAVDNNDPFISKVPDFNQALAGPIISANDSIKGNKNADVSIVIFSDFTCAYCAEQEKLITQALSEFGDKILVVWKDFPETDKDSMSYKAALAGRCAQEAGKFWDYHDRLYDLTGNIKPESFLNIATDLGLDSNSFNKCMDSAKADQLIQDNIEEAYALDINGVPFIYVNKQEIFGRLGYEDLKRLIEIELESE
jgi:predicted DsbA family dithiol-disulfide isomerase